MPTEIIFPKVDMDMASGQIARWFVAPGAPVKKGDILFEIETAKATMEIDAPADGRIDDITGEVGVEIPVGRRVAWIYADGEAAAAVSEPTSPQRAAGAPTSGTSGELPRAAETPADTADRNAVRPVPEPPTGTAPSGQQRNGAVRASPLARRLARQAGIDIAVLAGSGPHGRVVRADIDQAVKGRRASSDSPLDGAGPRTPGDPPVLNAPLASSLSAHGVVSRGSGQAEVPSPVSDDGVLALFREGSYELVAHDNMRRTIARRLVEAKSTIPHFYLTLDCELDAVLALRRQLNAGAPTRRTEKGDAALYRLSVNDFVIKAMALALHDVPDANVSWTEAAMVRHKQADVGVAVSVPGGLITPIVRGAEQKTLSTISNEMKDLAVRARARKLKPEEHQGGTTAVSNLGMFGVSAFSAVINPPHATILAVGAAEERAVVRNGEITVANLMSVTLSADHRAVDGALGAELLSAFRRHIENPIGMLA